MIGLNLYLGSSKTVPPNDPKNSLIFVLNSLSNKFDISPAEVFCPSGRETNSGIIFVPTVNARIYGLIDTKDTVQHLTNTEVSIYSGGAPKGFDPTDWDKVKRNNAERFKKNDVSIIVATSAFGMGIDKPKHQIYGTLWNAWFT